MKIIVDNREQRPFSFRGTPYDGVAVEAGTLAIGDYSLAGLTDRAAVERKELADLVACLGRERDRFERELARPHGRIWRRGTIGAVSIRMPRASLCWPLPGGIAYPSSLPGAVRRRST